VQEAVTRLGSRLPYQEAQEELELMWGVTISVATVREITMRHGRIADELIEKERKELAEEAPAATAKPNKLVMSADGAMVQLRNGEWGEVKTVAFGEFETKWDGKNQEVVTKTEKISYFASADKAEQFSDKAIVEWQRRGGENAAQVVAVNDGAAWIQSFIDYHCPQAIRVIDFAHAQAYVATVGKAVYGADSETFKQWYAKMSKQLGQKAPQRTLNDLRFLWTQNQTHPEADEIEHAIRYLERREAMIDYPHFRRNGIPIGSGMVESGHKVVVQRRMKQAGMRWAEENLNPMLALRMAICNKRWASSWRNIQAHFLATKYLYRHSEKTDAQQPQLVSEADVENLERLARKVQRLTRKKRPWQDHRWIFPHRARLLHKN
jgi:hypothetical protein